MSYAVKEIFLTLQGEGAHAGRPAVFCRFAGCNLWSGHERDRDAAICRFCDTDFVGMDGQAGGRFGSAEILAAQIEQIWGPNPSYRSVVLTGGEPMLQVDAALIESLHRRHFWVALETNGTLPIPHGVDWVCVSPKADTHLVVTSGSELKLAFPQSGVDPSAFAHLAFRSFRLQPIDGPRRDENTSAAIAYCLANPQWNLSVQTHKALGLP